MIAARTAPSATREVADRLVEVGLRRGLDAVGPATEVDDVEVVLEDLVLVVALVELDRDQELLGLARVGALLRQVDVLRVLLRDRRAALRGPALEVVPERAADALGRDAVVLVERAVLGREHRLLDVLGNLVDRDVDAVLVAEPADLGLAVAVVDDGRLRTGQLVRRRDVGLRVGHAHQGDHRQKAHRDECQELLPGRHETSYAGVLRAGVVDSQKVLVQLSRGPARVTRGSKPGRTRRGGRSCPGPVFGPWSSSSAVPGGGRPAGMPSPTTKENV